MNGGFNINNGNSFYDQGNHMYNSGNTNFGNTNYAGGCYGVNTAYGNSGYNPQGGIFGTGSSHVPFIICSVFMIFSGIAFYFLDLIRKALYAVREGANAVRAAINYDIEGAITGAARTVSSALDVLNHTVTALTLVMIITGIVGIIFAAVFGSRKYRFRRSKLKIIPALCGAAAIVTSVVYAVLLIMSHCSFGISLCILAVIFVTPIFFTKTALKFYRC